MLQSKGYTDNGAADEALRLFGQMELEGASPTSVTFACSLKACGNTGDIEKGQFLCSKVVMRGLERGIVVGCSIVDMYTKCGFLSEAQDTFDQLPGRNVITWTALIAGYAEHGAGHLALKYFNQMQLESVYPNASTFACSLKACGIIGDLETGRELHIEVVKRGFERDICVANTLLDMYAKCGSLEDGQEIFESLPVQDVVSWTAMIHGCVAIPEANMAVEPNTYMYVALLKACTKLNDAERGQGLYIQIVHKALEEDPFIGNALVDMYGKCGFLLEARQVFDRFPARDAVSWNTLITAYFEHGLVNEALRCFQEMQLAKVCPAVVTFTCILKACGAMGALEMGWILHTDITNRRLEDHLELGNALIDMYIKCASLAEGRRVFDKLRVRDVVSWNTLIRGYGENHDGDMAIQLFEEMQEQGLKPSAVTFTCLLAACSQGSLVIKGQNYFQAMRGEYGVNPLADHYACVVDLLARSGQIEEAERFIAAMQSHLPEDALTALLSACKSHGELKLGRKCFKQLSR